MMTGLIIEQGMSMSVGFGKRLIHAGCLLLLLLAGCSDDQRAETQGSKVGQLADLAAFMELRSDAALFLRDEDEFRLLIQGLDEQMARGDLPVRTGKPLRALLKRLQQHQQAGTLSVLGLADKARGLWSWRNGLPLLQLELADGPAFAEALKQAQQEAGESWDGATFSGVPFYRNKGPETELIWLVHAQQLLLAWFPVGQEQAVLERLLGGDALLNEDVRKAALAALPQSYRQQGFSRVAGWLDTGRLFKDLLQKEDTLHQNWRRILEIPEKARSAECQADLQQWLDLFPGLVFSQVDDAAGNRTVDGLLQLSPAIARPLQAAVSRFVAPGEAEGLIELQLALNLQAFHEGVQGFLQQDAPVPRGCEWLKPSYQALDRLRYQLAHKPLPGLVRKVRGLGASLDFNGSMLTPETIRSMFWLKMEQPEILLNMASMVEPALSADQWPADGKARPLHSTLAQGRFQQPLWLAVSDDGLGVALGEGMEQPLEHRLAANPEPAGTLLWMRQDLRRIFALMGRQGGMMQAMSLRPDALVQLDRYSRKLDQLDLRLQVEQAGLQLHMEQRVR